MQSEKEKDKKMGRKKMAFVYLYPHTALPSADIQRISDEWTKLANDYGDSGSCVMGAGIEFTYNGIRYLLMPRSRWQGSCSWEHDREKIMKELEQVGCSEVCFKWGYMD
jgi:hypothetical protein